MASPAGILRAKTMNLGSSGLVDVISTPFLFETVNIFKGTREAGKCFTMLRHPVDRAISMYHHFKITESGNPSAAQYGGMTIDEFAGTFDDVSHCFACPIIYVSNIAFSWPRWLNITTLFGTILLRLVCRE